jgi:hypothetical protein
MKSLDLHFLFSLQYFDSNFLFDRRVHISEKTLNFLHGEFEVIDGDGASREEAIRLAGIKTYFIVRVLKPVSLIQEIFKSISNSLKQDIRHKNMILILFKS